MSNEQEQPKTLLDLLKSNWIILAFFISLAVTWGTYLANSRQTDIRLEKLETQQAQSANALQAVRESQVRIETQLEIYFKDN